MKTAALIFAAACALALALSGFWLFNALIANRLVICYVQEPVWVAILAALTSLALFALGWIAGSLEMKPE
jgi:hypothetical protein